jgi:hypothetical protein
MEYYPPLSSLISPDALPDFLAGIQGGLANLLSNIRLKEYQVIRHTHFGGRSWYLVLRTSQRVDLEIFGTGLNLIFNPSLDPNLPGSYTDIPISLSVRIPILAEIDDFNLMQFAESPDAFFKLISKYVSAEDAVIVNAVIENVVPNADPQELINQINAHYGLLPPIAVTLTGDPITDTPAIVNAIENHPTLSGTDSEILQVLFEVYVLNPSPPIPPFEFIEKAFAPYFIEGAVKTIKRLLIPEIDASIGISAGLEFPREYLIPIDANNVLETNPAVKTVIIFNAGEFRFSTKGIIGFNSPIVATFPPAYPKAQIGNTGITIGFSNAKLDLSRTKNIPEAIADGRPNDFIGVFIEHASIGLPAFWERDNSSQAEIIGTNLLIGTGGLSGTISLDKTNGPLFKTWIGGSGGFEINLDSFGLTFKQNTIVSSDIYGKIIIPSFEDANGGPVDISIAAHIYNDGDFSITASEPQGIELVFKPGGTEIFRLIVKTLTFEKNDGIYGLGISGELDITAPVPGNLASQFLPEKVTIQKLVIYSNGKFEFVGGVNLLPKALTMKLGPAEVQISNLSLGSFEKNNRHYLYFGFDGGLNVDPGGVDVRASGIQFFFTNDGGPFDMFLRIGRIDVSLIIPGSADKASAMAIIEGYLAMRENGTAGSIGGPEYRGSVSLTLPKAGIKGSATMAYAPSVPSFAIDIELSLPAPIPLGPTGLGIYGFRGLLGAKYVATLDAVGLPDDANWWEYYKAPPQDGVIIDKMEQKPGFSLGAGVSLATAADSGRAFSSKLFFMLSLPDVVLLQGQAAMLAERIDLASPDDPPFSAFLAFTSQSITGGFGVNIGIPKSNPEIVKVNGALEFGFFFQNASAWYVNIGRDQPESKRIQGRVFDIFNVYAFLMLSGSGIKAGAGASYKFDKTFLGVVKVHLEAQLDVGGFVNFRPQQIGGFVYIGGALDISVFGIGFYFGASAYLGAEAPKPFIITGKIHVEFRVKLLFIKKTFEFDIELTWQRSTAKNTTPLALMNDGGEVEFAPYAVGKSVSAKAVNIATLETYDIYFAGTSLPANPTAWSGPNYVIPMDSWLDLKFARSVQPDLNDAFLQRITTLAIAANHVENYPPQPGPTAQVKHDFRLDKIEIKYHDGTSWHDYDLFQALPTSDFITNLPTSTPPVITINDLLLGSWQASEVPGSYTNLRLLAANPFSFLNQTSGNPETTLIENFGFSASMLFCNQELIDSLCQNWNPINVNQTYTPGSWFFDRDLWIMMDVPGATIPQNLIVQDRPDQPLPGITHALAATQNSFLNQPVTINVKFPEPVVQYSVTYLVEPCEGDQGEGPALNFDGRDEMLLIKDHKAYGFEMRFTWGIWIDPEIIKEPNEKMESNFQSLLTKGLPGLTGEEPFAGGYRLRIAKIDSGPLIELWAELTMVDPLQPSNIQVITARWFVEDQWYFISFAKSGKFSADVELLVNGKSPQQRQDSNPSSSIISLKTNAPIIIGYRGYAGNVDAPRLYGYALSQAQIDAQYQASRCENAIVPTDYVGFWQLNEVQGIVAPDISANLNNGNLVNYATTRTAVNGGAWPELPCVKTSSVIANGPQRTVLSFDNPFERLVIPNVNSVLPNSGQFTIETWVDTPIDPVFNPNTTWFTSSFMSLNGLHGMEVRIAKGPVNQGLCEVHIVVQVNGFTFDSRFRVADDWMYLVIRSSGLNPADWNVRLNDQIPFMVNAYGTTILPITSSDPLIVGSGYGNFIGKIDLLRIYDRPLSDAEIHDIYTSGRCNPLEISNGLFGSWMLDETQGDVVPEKSGNPNLEAGLVGYGPARILSGGGAWQDSGCGNNCIYTVTFNSQDEHTETEVSIPVLGGSSLWRRVSLLEVCWTTFTTYSYNVMQSQINDNRDEQLASLAYQMQNVLQPVWRPNTNFAVIVTGRDLVDNSGPIQKYVYGFRTKGPVGNFLQHRPAPENIPAETDKYKLSSLKPYVDYQRSYPNADGNIINAKPLYYKQGENNLLLFFNFPAAYNMFRDWPVYGALPLVNSEINISIIESVDQSSPTIPQNWIPDEHTSESLDVQILHNVADNSMGDGANCEGFSFDYVHNRHLTISPPDLKPLKLYTAIFNGKLNANVNEILRYAFQTSRYGSFPQHINSYDLGNGRSALSTVKLSPLDLVKAGQILSNALPATDTLVTEYMHPFDRLIRGALGLNAIDAPMTTDITILTNNSGTITYGVLLRSPEPFNDPKLPEPIQQDGIDTVYTPLQTMTKLFSKDGTQVFITNSNLQLPTGTLTLTFRQKQFDGNNFVNNMNHPFPVINISIA